MRRARWVIALVVVAAGVFWSAPAAEAGGASFVMDRASYEPGDRAVGRTGINWAHNPQLGTPEDGPYYAYLVPMASMVSLDRWPYDPAELPGAVFVDVIERNETLAPWFARLYGILRPVLAPVARLLEGVVDAVARVFRTGPAARSRHAPNHFADGVQWCLIGQPVTGRQMRA